MCSEFTVRCTFAHDSVSHTGSCRVRYGLGNGVADCYCATASLSFWHFREIATTISDMQPAITWVSKKKHLHCARNQLITTLDELNKFYPAARFRFLSGQPVDHYWLQAFSSDRIFTAPTPTLNSDTLRIWFGRSSPKNSKNQTGFRRSSSRFSDLALRTLLLFFSI